MVYFFFQLINYHITASGTPDIGTPVLCFGYLKKINVRLTTSDTKLQTLKSPLAVCVSCKCGCKGLYYPLLNLTSPACAIFKGYIVDCNSMWAYMYMYTGEQFFLNSKCYHRLLYM